MAAEFTRSSSRAASLKAGLKMQALLLMGCVALRESQDFSEPRLPHL